MSRDRANWDDHTTPIFLDHVAKQKELCHWSDKCPSSIGWTNIYHSFNVETNLNYRKKQVQNKFNDLKWAYLNWRDGRTHTGLGRDPDTGEVAVDPVWYAAVHGESSQTSCDKYKRPPCCDKLFSIFGHTPRDRGQLVSAGGHGTEENSSAGSPQTPQELSDEAVRSRSVGQSSKRSSRDHSVCSPIKKKSTKTPSLDDCVEDLSDIIKDSKEKKSSRQAEAEEMAKVNQILQEDGYNESDLFFAQALNLCTNRVHRRAFLDLETKEGRANFVKVSWDVMTLKSK